MAIKRVAAPDVEPVDIDEAKDHLNIDSNDKDALIGTYISAARAHIEDYCHTAVARALWELAYDAFPSAGIEIPKAPLLSIASVKYDDVDGVEQTVDTADYYVDLISQFGWVIPASTWPSTISAANSVRVRFYAGYADDEVPLPLKQATLLLVGHFFEHREPVTTTAISTLPLSVEALIGPYRVPVFA